MPPPPDRRRSSSGRPKGGRPASGRPATGRSGAKPPARGAKPAGRAGKPAGRPSKPERHGSGSGTDDRAGRGGSRSATSRSAGPKSAGARRSSPPGRSSAAGASRGSRDRARGRDDSRAGQDDHRDRRRDDGRKGVPPPKGRGASWGGLARRAASAGGTNAPLGGSGRLRASTPSAAAEAFRTAGGRDAAEARDEVEIVRVDDTGDVESAARGAVRRGGNPTARAADTTGRPSRKSAKLAEELADHVGPSTAPKLGIRLADAGRAFEAERYLDAKRILAGLVKRAPGSAPVRELHGLTLYRLGRWEAAAKEVEAFRALTGSTEQHPVLADCYRALHRWDEVDRLWQELREVSPSAELVAEGRIVYAGSLADRGDVVGAIAAIEPATKNLRKPREHHLRLLYVLGDLYERAGEVPRARAAFDRVLAADRDFGDAAARRRALS